MPCIYICRDSILNSDSVIEEFYQSVSSREEGESLIKSLNNSLTEYDNSLHVEYRYSHWYDNELEFYEIE